MGEAAADPSWPTAPGHRTLWAHPCAGRVQRLCRTPSTRAVWQRLGKSVTKGWLPAGSCVCPHGWEVTGTSLPYCLVLGDFS